jgi:molybdenum cofactor synthesis domain-containing protein
MAKTVTAALAIIGNEILSGRTQDANLAFLGKSLNDIGIQLREVRVVPDVEAEIVDAVNALRARYDYVFTTGGIGPTHDDITPESVAKAFGRRAVYHPEAYERLRAWYEANGREFTEMRKRMALMPEGAELIDNPVSVAPGFKIGNVFVLAGVPQIMRSMFEAAKPHLRGGERVGSRSISTRLVEGILAGPLKAVQERHPDADIGSYPFYNTPNGTGVALVVRSTSPAALKAAGDEILAMIAALGGEVLEDVTA